MQTVRLLVCAGFFATAGIAEDPTPLDQELARVDRAK